MKRMTREEFVHMVRDAYAVTGLLPQREVFRTEIGGVGYACAVGALVSAHDRQSADSSGDWITRAQKILPEPYDFYDGVTAGFDGCPDPYFESEDFQRGVDYGLAAAKAMFPAGPQEEADFSETSAAIQTDEPLEADVPLVLAP